MLHLQVCLQYSDGVVLNVTFIFLFVEIEARPDMESDKKLDKLESFLGRINSKGIVFRHIKIKATHVGSFVCMSIPSLFLYPNSSQS